MLNRLFYWISKHSFNVIAIIFLIILLVAVIFKKQIFESDYSKYFQFTFWYVFGMLTGFYLLKASSDFMRKHPPK